MEYLELAKKAYEAYGKYTNNKNFRGEEMPLFNDLPESIKNAWKVAVIEVEIQLKEKSNDT